MRIIGQVPHPQLGITVFKSNNKIILKFEIGPFEQTYKFLETEKLSGFDQAKELINAELLEQVFSVFDQMNNQYKKLSETLN